MKKLYAISLTLLLIPLITKGQVHEPIEAYMQDNSSFSGVVLVAQGGEIIHAKSYGASNHEHKIKNTLATNYPLGSISKSFTAVAILKLQELGKLKVDEKITKYLDSIPSQWNDITIHHLLSNSSGLSHTMSNTEFWKSSAFPKTSKEIVKHFSPYPLLSSPGAAYNYSGLGFYLLAMIIEKTSKMPYSDFMNEQIFAKSQLSETYSLNQELPIANLASGYIEENGAMVKSRKIHPANALGGGSIYTTILDLYEWQKKLFNEEIISKESLTNMLNPIHNNYAYGWFVVRKPEYESISHGGAVPGLSTYIAKYSKHNNSVMIVFSNFPNSTKLKFRDVVKSLKEIVLKE